MKTFRLFLIALWALTLIMAAANAATPVLYMPMEMNDEGEVTEAVSHHSYSVRGKHGDNIDAVVGKGLRTDGYSAFVQVPISNYALNPQALSISLWTACQTYPMMNSNEAEDSEAAIISCLDDTNKRGFAFYLYSQGRYGFCCYVNGEKKNLAPAALFPQYQWVHLAATVDGAAGSIILYQNGKQVATAYAKGSINLPTGNLYIGKSANDVKTGQFYLNTYNGIIDELNIYNAVLTSSDIQAMATTTAALEMNIPASHFHSDLTRPRHHAMPASNWMNESHGMAYSNHRYHLFFQKNGNGPYMARLHWGHLSSADLCNWHEERIAIVPGKAYDIKGCWSGCVFTDHTITHGEPWILYTGVNNAKASINIAAPVDDGLNTWTKAAHNPVISGTPAGYSADFRDPYFFRHGNDAYCIVGTSRNGVAAASLHKYNAATGMFDYTGVPFFTGNNANQCGTFFEMPAITPLGDGRWLLTATPLGTAMGVRTIYYVGSINDDGTFSTTQAAPKTVELPALARDGYGLLSPTILQKDGKIIAMGIVPDKLSSSANYQAGWAHTLSFPREWSIDAQGELVQKPYEGLQALRSSNTVSVQPQTLQGELSLSPVSGPEIEVQATFTVAEAPFGIKILQNDQGDACNIYFSPQSNRFTIDCSGIGRKNNDSGIFDGVYTTGLPTAIQQGQTMKIHLFFDHSVLDVFINDRWATSVRIFPTSSSATGVSLFAQGDTHLQSAQAWTMIPADTDLMDGLDDIYTQPAVSGAHNATKQISNGRVLIHRHSRTYLPNGMSISSHAK